MPPPRTRGTSGDYATRSAVRNGGDVRAGSLYKMCLEAQPPVGGWFAISDTLWRFGLAMGAFYRFLLTEPIGLLKFAFGWNCMWCAKHSAVTRTAYCSVLPFGAHH